MADKVSDEAFARHVNQAGMATYAEVEEARALQAAAEQKGKPITLGAALVLQGAITETQRENLEKRLLAQQAGGLQRLGDYKLLKKLGEGGMGTVYLAEDIHIGRQVAIKVLPKKYSEDPDFLHRFRREAQATGKLNHVNIVCAHDVGEEHGTHYYVMEYCDGEPLDATLRDKQFLHWEKTLEIVMQVARGLKHAHEHGFIHRDIKPANILYTKEGVAKILDMGLSKHIGTGQQTTFNTQTGVAMGTPHYVSPEQARGEKTIDGRADIYSLGATFYHLVTGETPFKGSTPAMIMLKHMQEQLPNPQDIREDIPDRVAQVIQKMMAKEPADRYRDCKELLDDLELVIDGKSPSSAMLDVGKSSVAMPRVPRAGRALIRKSGIHQAVEISGAGVPARTGPRKSGIHQAVEVSGDAQGSHKKLAPAQRQGTNRQEPVEGSRAQSRGARRPSEQRETIRKAGGANTTYIYIGAGAAGLILFVLLIAFGGGSKPPEKTAAANNPSPETPNQKPAANPSPPSNQKPATTNQKPQLSAEAQAERDFEAALKGPEDKEIRIARLESFLRQHGKSAVAARARTMLAELKKTPAQPPSPPSLVTAPAAIATVPIPADAAEFNGHRYKVYWGKLSWHEAKKKCEELGGHLATITTKEEDEFIAGLKIPQGDKFAGLCLGATDEAHEGKWAWLTGEPFQYVSWGKNEPNGKSNLTVHPEGEHYLALVIETGRWGDIASKNPYIAGFLCEWEPATVAKPETATQTPGIAVDDPERWKDAIDLLALIDLAKDQVSGDWRMEPGALLCNGTSKVEVPYRPGREYEELVAFTLESNNGDHYVNFSIPCDETESCVLAVGTNGSKGSGFHRLNGKCAWENATSVTTKIGTGRHRVVIKVANEGIVSSLDEKPLTSWKPSQGKLTAGDMALRDKSVLGFAPHGAKVRIHSVKVLEISGPGTFTRPDDPAAKVALAQQEKVRAARGGAPTATPATPDKAIATIPAAVQAAVTTKGTILREHWANVPGGTVASLTGNGVFPEKPSSTTFLSSFSFNEPVEQNFGTRVRGFIHPPQTGNYVLWIASDDASELWLSKNDSPGTKVKIAELKGYTQTLKWDQEPGQQSAPIPLAAGQRYYIEVLHKQGGGGALLAVGWQLPDGILERPIPGTRLSPFVPLPTTDAGKNKLAALAEKLDLAEQALKGKMAAPALATLLKSLDEIEAELKPDRALIIQFAERLGGARFDVQAAREGELAFYKARVRPAPAGASELFWDFSTPEQLAAWTLDDPSKTGEMLPVAAKGALPLKVSKAHVWDGTDRKTMPVLKVPFLFKQESWVFEASVTLVSDKRVKAKPRQGILVWDGNTNVLLLLAGEGRNNEIDVIFGGSTPLNDKFFSRTGVLSGRPQDTVRLQMICANGTISCAATANGKTVTVPKLTSGFEPRFAALGIRTAEDGESAVAAFDDVKLVAVPDSAQIKDAAQAARAAAAAAYREQLLKTVP